MEEQNATTEKAKFSVHDLIWILIGFIAGVLVGYLVFITSLGSAVKDTTASAVETTMVAEA